MAIAREVIFCFLKKRGAQGNFVIAFAGPAASLRDSVLI